MAPVLQANKAVRRWKADGVAGGKDRRIGGAAVLIDDDAVFVCAAVRGVGGVLAKPESTAP